MLLLHRGYEMSSNREPLRTTGHSTSGSRPASDAAGPCQRSGSTYGALRRYLSMSSKAERASIPGDRRQGKAWGLLSSCDENLCRWSVCALGVQGMPNTESTEYTERKKTAELFQCVYDRQPQFVAMGILRGTEPVPGKDYLEHILAWWCDAGGSRTPLWRKMMNERRNSSAPGSRPTRRQLIAGIGMAIGGVALGPTEAWAGTEEEGSRTAETIHQEILFKASRKRVYEALTDAKQFDKVIHLAGAMRMGAVNVTATTGISPQVVAARR